MASKNGVFAPLLLLIVEISGLIELPRVEDNNILTTEVAIRDTINSLFSILQLKDVKKKPKLKEYSIVHNHLISFTLQDYNNLKEIAKLTRVDKNNTNNETVDFIAALNNLLNEDIETERKNITYGNNDDNVTKYVQQFLAKLEYLKDEYGINSENLRIKNEVYEILKENEISSYNDTVGDGEIDNSDEENSVLGENYFWKPEKLSRRVYRGERIKINHFPFMASIQIFNQFYCSGSIIKSDLVISASSCLQLAYNNRFFRENPAFLSVRVGSTFYNSGENIAVLEVYFHPDYDPKNLRNNLCILRLVRKINLKRKKVKKIDFDRTASPLPLTTDGITIIGWGSKGTNNLVMDPWRQQLAYAVLDFYPLRECQDVYSKEYVTKKNFCAGFFSTGGGACNRDVGGPGVVEGILMGVVSFGSPVCGTPDAPTVFTKLGYYTDWIEEIMEQDVPSAYKRTTLRPERVFFTIPDYTITAKTTFKIPPLSGTLEPIPIHEVDALRMLQNSAMFQEFLATMFGGKDSVQYQDLVEKPVHKVDYHDMVEKDNLRQEKVTMDTATHLITMLKDIQPLTSSYTIDMYNLATPLGNVDPEDNTTYSTTEIPAIDSKKTNTIVKIGKDAELEKDLVDLIDNIDLKQIIEHISSLEEDKIIDDSKLIEMIEERNVDGKISNIDDTVLTLLYLSDYEKKSGQQNPGQKNDLAVSQLNNNDDDESDDEQDDETSERGLSIDTAGFKDLTFRNQNISVLKKILPKEDLYDLLSDSLNANADLNKKY